MKHILFILFLLFVVTATAQQIAPNGFYVINNKVYNNNNQEIRFKGVNRPSLEWASKGKYLLQEDIVAIALTGANIVRIPLNQDFWLKDTDAYQSTVNNVIHWCMSENLNVILDLHWSQKNDPNETAAQQHHADELSLLFWQQVATKYQDNGKILFDLYNEPHKISWDEIVNGGIQKNATYDESDDWTMVGYQQLYNTVRETGAHNLIIIGGNNWTFDLSYYENTPIDGYNIMYATHCYPYSNKLSDNWYKWTKLAKTHPVIVSEFGPKEYQNTDYVSELMDTINRIGAHWTAWAWYSFKKNNMWSSFNPATEKYDTTFYGSWIIKQLKQENTHSTHRKQTESSLCCYPNPAQNEITIENNGQNWAIISIGGQIVLRGKQEKIDITTLKPGIYLYKAKATTLKFIKTSN